MRSSRLLLISVLLLCAPTLLGDNGQVYFRFQIESVKELPELTKVISIDNVRGDTVWAFATDPQFEYFSGLGYDYQILPDPSSLFEHRMAKSPAEMKAWNEYPSYWTYVEMMESYALDYPSLCVLDTIGYGEDEAGLMLLVVRISDNVGIEEFEPEVLYTSSMHGDEITGYVLMLRLIDYLLTNYGSDAQVTNMVNNLEIWINPLANPDGTYYGDTTSVNNARRYNDNNIDLNRNFPDPQDGQHPDGHLWQSETIAMMDLAEAHNFVISANFHGGAEVINYPWDTWPQLHADDSWLIDISRRYADSAQANSPPGYLTDLNNGITNGYAWYTISGGRQDYMTYFRGGREVTAEISSDKNPPGDDLPAYWNYNRAALLNYLENALYGVKGIVTDSLTGAPLAAVVTVLDHDVDSSRVFTDPDVGDYHRLISPGTYDFRFTAPGYVAKTITGVSVAAGSVTSLDVQLAQLTGDPVLSVYDYDVGIVDPGDTVDFYITLINDGGGNGNNVTATLSTADSHVSVLQGTAAYPMIPAQGGAEASLTAYRFAVADTCPQNHTTTFALEIYVDSQPHGDDNFSIVIGVPREDFETGDYSAYPWEMSGNADWYIVPGGVESGVYCSRSGSITHYQSTEMYVTLDITQPDDISFFYKVSSESGWDYLRFYVDGVQKGQWSGTIDWTQTSYAVSAGEHTFKWTYEKDGSQSHGSDCGWVDFIVFPPTTQALTITTVSLPDWTEGQLYSRQLVAEGGVGTKTWSDLGGDLTGTGLTLSGSGLLSGIPVASGQISFVAHVEDQGGSSADQPLSFTINPPVTITTIEMPDGAINVPYSCQLEAGGGTGVMTWSDVNNDLSDFGLSLSEGGLVSGTPSSSGPVTFTAAVTDITGSADEKELSFEIAAEYLCGDADGNGLINVSDAVYLIAFIFASGPPPEPILAGDADCNEIISVSDAVYLLAYIFGGGPAPCAECKS